MTKEPFNLYELDEIVLFDGTGDLIEFHRDGKYIYLEKPDNERTKYRFDLQKNHFERLNFYKTTEDKITLVDTRNVTQWFKDCRLVTKDLHFGRLAIFAKYNRAFDRYSSPVRFIEMLGHSIITNIEKWESLGFKVREMEDFFGDFQCKRVYSGPIDRRKDIFLGNVPRNYSSYYNGQMTYGPQDFTKSLLKHLLSEYDTIDNGLLRKFKQNYNEGEDIIEDKLMELAEDPEFRDCFDYEANNYHEDRPEKNLLMEDRQSFNLRMNLIDLIKRYDLNLESVARWIKRQSNVEKNDIIFLLETGHYSDYLRCEYELKNGTRSNMVKYPKNFRTEFHKVQTEYAANKAQIDKQRFERQHLEFADLESNNKKCGFIVKIPREPYQIEQEADCLKHCVRTYIQPMAEGRTTILFLRRKEEPDVPYVTLEVKNGVLKQAYGENDHKPDKKALEFLRRWCKKKDVLPGCWTKELSL